MKHDRRLQVPATPEVRAMLQAYADATGSSLASTCEQILIETAPVMYELAQAIQEAKKAPSRAIREAVGLLDRKVAEGQQLSFDVSGKPRDGRRKKVG